MVSLCSLHVSPIMSAVNFDVFVCLFVCLLVCVVVVPFCSINLVSMRAFTSQCNYNRYIMSDLQ